MNTKANKTVHEDIEISMDFSYVIYFPGYLMFGVGRVVSWNFLLFSGMSLRSTRVGVRSVNTGVMMIGNKLDN